MNSMKQGSGEVALGVDGGASHLRFCVSTRMGEVSHYECGGANPNLDGMESYVQRLSQGIVDALARVGCTPDEVTSAGLGLSGVDRDEEIARLTEGLRALMPNCHRLWVGNDALPALRQGAGELRGIVLIAGTGSICYGSTKSGALLRVGGWGGELGDEGSGFWIGLKALQGACRMADGRVDETWLLKKVLEHFGLNNAMELIPWASSRTRWEFKNQVASLFPIVSKLAIRGDHVSKQAIVAGINHLVAMALAAEARMRAAERKKVTSNETITNEEGVGRSDTVADNSSQSLDPITLVCAGGLFKNSKDFFEAFEYQLRRRSNRFKVVRLDDASSIGALSLGREAISLAVEAQTMS